MLVVSESQVIEGVGVDEDILLRAGDARHQRQLAGRGGPAAHQPPP